MHVKSIAFALAFFAAAWLTGPAGADATEPPAGLSAARQAFEDNLALGDALNGQPATQQQADEAQRLYEAAIGGAQAYLRGHTRAAEAHWLAGAILCGAYRPVETPSENDEQQTTTLARGCVRGCEEGLAEFRAALHLDESNLDCMLDYAEAMLRCDDVAGCYQECTSIWQTRRKVSKPQAARCARLLADCACHHGRVKEELRWLEETLQLDPKDVDSAVRLGQLLAEQPDVSWLPFEVGQAVAAQTKKPMVVDFTAAWCGWCHKLEQETYPNPKVVALLKQFVCVRVDGDRRRDLASKYRVNGYPTTLVLHPSGHVLRTIVGYLPADKYAAELDEALKITIE